MARSLEGSLIGFPETLYDLRALRLTSSSVALEKLVSKEHMERYRMGRLEEYTLCLEEVIWPG
jgi:hypothetical protein